MTEMNQIRERVEREQYQIDSQAVARALIERLLAGRVVSVPLRAA
jgi:anti-sigma28 factor (negative regulator of flagellin synthesis)